MKRDEPSRSALRLLLALAGWAGVLVALACAAVVWLPGRGYYLDLAAHALWAAWPAAVIPVLVLIFAKRWRSAIVGVVALVVWFAGVWSAATAYAPERPSAGPAAEIRVAFYNIRGMKNRGGAAFEAWVAEHAPDVLCIAEADNGVLSTMPSLRERYPHRIEQVSGMRWPMLVLSTRPFLEVGMENGYERNRRSFIARRGVRIEVSPGVEVLVGPIHLTSPRSEETWQLGIDNARTTGALVAEWVQETGVPVIVPGDFNTTPLGRAYRAFGEASGLRSSERLIGGGTWPARLPAIASIPIDRVWTSPELVRSVPVVGPRFGSDHRPIYLDVSIPSPAR